MSTVTLEYDPLMRDADNAEEQSLSLNVSFSGSESDILDCRSSSHKKFERQIKRSPEKLSSERAKELPFIDSEHDDGKAITYRLKSAPSIISYERGQSLSASDSFRKKRLGYLRGLRRVHMSDEQQEDKQSRQDDDQLLASPVAALEALPRPSESDATRRRREHKLAPIDFGVEEDQHEFNSRATQASSSSGSGGGSSSRSGKGRGGRRRWIGSDWFTFEGKFVRVLMIAARQL